MLEYKLSINQDVFKVYAYASRTNCTVDEGVKSLKLLGRISVAPKSLTLNVPQCYGASARVILLVAGNSGNVRSRFKTKITAGMSWSNVAWLRICHGREH